MKNICEGLDAHSVDEIQFHYLDVPDFGDRTAFISPIAITAVGEIFEDGLVIAAIRIEYSGEIGAGLLLPAHFQVPGRKIKQTYVNNTGKRKVVTATGTFLFLELLTNENPDSNEFKEISGTYRYYPAGPDWTIDLPMIVSVRQINTVFNCDGRKIIPFNRANDDQYIELADGLRREDYKDPETGITIRYNLFIPAGYEKKSEKLDSLPLVFFLHGAGESGFDNRITVTAYRQAQEYIRDEVQRETPCFVMIPQCPMTEERGRGPFLNEEFGWYTYIKNGKHGPCCTWPSKSLRTAINALLHKVMPAFNIDENHIYAAGHSMGGGGAVAAMVERPDIFAAGLSFASPAVFPDEMLERIRDKPVFFTVAEDESYAFIRENMLFMINRLEELGVQVYRSIGENAWDAALRGDAATVQAEDAIARAHAAGAKMIYAEFLRGTVIPDGHLSHRASFANAGIRSWLFKQRR